jgi:hypothetical protein
MEISEQTFSESLFYFTNQNTLIELRITDARTDVIEIETFLQLDDINKKNPYGFAVINFMLNNP